MNSTGSLTDAAFGSFVTLMTSAFSSGASGRVIV
jgi:hypothetical protein